MKPCTPVIAAFIFLLAGCAVAPVTGGPLPRARLTDGVYEGGYGSGPNKASVRVTIRDRAIADIQVIEHWAWRGKGVENHHR